MSSRAVTTTVLNLKLFCKKEQIPGYSRLKKVELLKLLYDRKSVKCNAIVSLYLKKVPLKELVGFYENLPKSDFQLRVTRELEYLDSTSWNTISRDYCLTTNFIKTFRYLLNWNILSQNKNLTEKQIIYFSGYIQFDKLSSRPCLSIEIIRRFNTQLNWYTLSSTQRFTEAFLEEIITQLQPNCFNWCFVLLHHRLSEKFLDKHVRFMSVNVPPGFRFWVYVAETQRLSENFILKHKYFLSWSSLCIYQDLSSNVLTELSKLVAPLGRENVNRFWFLVSTFQRISRIFLHEHKEKINWQAIIRSRLLTEDFILEFKDKLNRRLLLEYQNHLPSEFIENHLTPFTKIIDTFFCPVCLEDVKSGGVKTNTCGHRFCKECIEKCLDIKSICPYCRATL